mgnify:CR=1 FL=1
MELYNGRPTDLTGREDREIRVYDLLDSLGIEYQRTDHGHADTMEACNEIDAVLDEDVLKGEYVGCHPCVNTSSLKIKTADVFGKYLDAVHHTATTIKLIGED